MKKLEFALKELNLVIIGSERYGEIGHPNVKATIADMSLFVALLVDNGFKPSLEQVSKLIELEPTVKDLQKVATAVKEVMGSAVQHSYLLDDFPTIQLDKYESQLGYWGRTLFSSFKGLYNYFTGKGLVNDYEQAPFNEEVKYREITFTNTVKAVDEAIVKLTMSKVPLRLDHEQLLAEIFAKDDPLLQMVDFTKIELREVLARFIAYAYTKNEIGIARSATDILRAVAILSGCENAKLDDKFKIKSLSNAQRRLIIQDLNKVARIEDLTAHKEMFKHLFKSLHLHSEKYKNINGRISPLAKTLQSINNPATKRSALHSIVKHGITGLDDVATLMDNPSLFARNLDKLVRDSGENLWLVLKGFLQVAEKVSPNVLLQLYGHFLNRDVDLDTRTFNLKGVNGGVKVVTDKPLKALPSELLNMVNDSIEGALKTKFKTKDNFVENICVHPSLYKFNIPAGLSNVDGLRTVARGTRVKMETKDILRMFVHWKASVDIDLSALFLDANFNTVTRCSYYDTRGSFYTHSGDVRSAPEGGSEFIDINLKQARERGIRYAVMYINSYSGQMANEIEEYFAGYMHRDISLTGKVYDPRTLDDKFSITGEVGSLTPCIFDLETSEMIWVNDAGHLGFGRGVDALVTNSRLYDIFKRKYVTVGKLVEMHGENVVSYEDYQNMTGDEKSKVKYFDQNFGFDATEITVNYL